MISATLLACQLWTWCVNTFHQPARVDNWFLRKRLACCLFCTFLAFTWWADLRILWEIFMNIDIDVQGRHVLWPDQILTKVVLGQLAPLVPPHIAPKYWQIDTSWPHPLPPAKQCREKLGQNFFFFNYSTQVFYVCWPDIVRYMSIVITEILQIRFGSFINPWKLNEGSWKQTNKNVL